MKRDTKGDGKSSRHDTSYFGAPAQIMALTLISASMQEVSWYRHPVVVHYLGRENRRRKFVGAHFQWAYGYAHRRNGEIIRLPGTILIRFYKISGICTRPCLGKGCINQIEMPMMSIWYRQRLLGDGGRSPTVLFYKLDAFGAIAVAAHRPER